MKACPIVWKYEEEFSKHVNLIGKFHTAMNWADSLGASGHRGTRTVAVEEEKPDIPYEILFNLIHSCTSESLNSTLKDPTLLKLIGDYLQLGLGDISSLHDTSWIALHAMS
ncbi:hypothetical protein F7725_009677 [Dissostichus mawsoni]|uniref:Uncharacterized protein n=1 Tax=Dissostichus mawsoni TaxID=36200 RepID=A0A7J5XMX5_DISMA|nr:hypothetical protein F7725_009677 [Dissostichus mawsoni]